MLRHTLRSLFRTRSFTIAALLCLALGIGATTTIFSIVNAVLFHPLPYPKADRLVRLYTEFPGFPNGGLHKFWVSAPEVFQLKQARSFSTVGAWEVGGVNFSTGANPVRTTAALVSADLLAALQVHPALGRTISADDDRPGAPMVAMLSYGEWKTAFAGDRSVVGRTVYLDGQLCSLIGVMPRGFAFPPGETDAPQIWGALRLDPKSTDYGGHQYSVLGRLRDGVSVQQARAEMNALVTHWGAAESDKHHVLSAKDHPVTIYSFRDEVVGGVKQSMYMLLGAVVFVLLIACVNVANLLLARSEGRQREIAIRRAIGASSRHLLAQFALEGTVLALCGAALGTMLAVGGLDLIQRLSPGSIPLADSIELDWRVFLFTGTVSLVCGVVFGLAPMLQVSALRIYETLKANSGRTSATAASHRFQSALVIAQMALSFILVAGSSLMIRGFVAMQHVDAGFNEHGLWTAELSLPVASYVKPEQKTAFLKRLQEELNRLPGVRSATIATGLPPIRPVDDDDTEIEGFVKRPGGPTDNVTFYQTTGERFFSTFGMRILEGRALDERDADPRTPGVVINRTMARTFWPGQSSVLGHRVRPGNGNSPWYRIVGVVADVKNAGVDKPTGTELYLPASAMGTPDFYIVARTIGDPMALSGPIRHAVQSLDPSLPLAKVRTMEQVMEEANARPRFLTVVMSMFSGLALLLAAVGIYGLISYSVAQRTPEFGIRGALGATPGGMMWQVMRGGLIMGLCGCCIGAAGALLVTRLLENAMFGFQITDFTSWIMALGVMLIATALACYVPALRVTRIQPVSALRGD